MNDSLCSYFTSLFKDIHIGQKKVGCDKKIEQFRPKTSQWPKTVKDHCSLPLDNCHRLGGVFYPTSSSLRYQVRGSSVSTLVILWPPWTEKGIVELAPQLKMSHPEMMHAISALTLWLKQVIWPHLTSRKWGLTVLPSPQRENQKYLMNNVDDYHNSCFLLVESQEEIQNPIVQKLIHNLSSTYISSLISIVALVPCVHSCQNSNPSLNIPFIAFCLHDFPHIFLCLTFPSFPIFFLMFSESFFKTYIKFQLFWESFLTSPCQGRCFILRTQSMCKNM